MKIDWDLRLPWTAESTFVKNADGLIVLDCITAAGPHLADCDRARFVATMANNLLNLLDGLQKIAAPHGLGQFDWEVEARDARRRASILLALLPR